MFVNVPINYQKTEQWYAFGMGMSHYSLLVCALLEWKRARPFLWIAACPHATSLVLSIIETLEEVRHQAVLLQLTAEVENCERNIELWRRKLTEGPPPLGPASGGLFSFYP
jgi:hypothetical protein